MTGKASVAFILLTPAVDALDDRRHHATRFGLAGAVLGAGFVLGPAWAGAPCLVGAVTYGLAAMAVARSGAGLR